MPIDHGRAPLLPSHFGQIRKTASFSGGQFCVDTAATGDLNHLQALQAEWTKLVTDSKNTK
jgi:hypothetical protein